MNLADYFAVLPNDRSERWRRLVAFISAWHGEITAADRVTEAELQDAEERLGAKLPATLREAYGTFGRKEEISRAFDVLLMPHEIRCTSRR